MELLTKNDPLLTQKSTPLTFPLSAEDKANLQALLTYVQDNAGCAGVAAAQFGLLDTVVVVTDKKRNPTLLINPIITLRSSLTSEAPEACLSLPGEAYMVRRHEVVKYAYRDTRGKLNSATARGFQARILQHELDHTKGILISSVGQPMQGEAIGL